MSETTPYQFIRWTTSRQVHARPASRSFRPAFFKPGPFAQYELQQCGGRGPYLLSDSSRTQSPRGVSSCLAFGQDEWVVRHRLSTALCASRFFCLWLEICVVFTSCRPWVDAPLRRSGPRGQAVGVELSGREAKPEVRVCFLRKFKWFDSGQY